MGVAIARKAIKGGEGFDHVQGSYSLGPSLQEKVKNFIGIAGINYGLMQCIPALSLNYCNKVDGLFPGVSSVSGPATFLNNLNQQVGS